MRKKRSLSDPPLSQAPNRGFLIAMGVFILIGLIFSIVNLHYMQHPVTHMIIVIAIAVLYALFVYHFNYAVGGQDASAVIWKFIIATLVFFVVVIGVGLISKSSRNQCIPKTSLVNKDGFIPDPDAYINFHKNCDDNKLIYDQPTIDFIKNNHHQPSWIMGVDGHTSDPVGWWIYYQGNPHSPYKLNDEVKSKLFSTYYLPKDILDSANK